MKRTTKFKRHLKESKVIKPIVRNSQLSVIEKIEQLETRLKSCKHDLKAFPDNLLIRVKVENMEKELKCFKKGQLEGGESQR